MTEVAALLLLIRAIREDGGEDDRTGWEGARVGARMRARVGAAAPTALDVHARAEVWMGGIRASVANAR